MSAKSGGAYQRNPFPEARLRASISYWNISSRPILNPRANITGINRKISAIRKICAGKDLIQSHFVNLARLLLQSSDAPLDIRGKIALITIP